MNNASGGIRPPSPIRLGGMRARRRRARRAIVRRRMVAIGVVVVVVTVGAVAISSSGSSTKAVPRVPVASLVSHTVAAVESGVLPWSLSAPISRELVLPGAGSALVIAGGLSAGQSSASGVFSLDTVTGTLSALGALPSAVHDAAGASVGGHDLVLGGGSPTTTAGVEAFAAPVGASGKVSPIVAGQLPQPRSDAVGVTIGTTAYVVGGYDGTNPDANVLATTDGQHFTTVATLAVPVRYPAAAAFGGAIYVFGGQAVTGASAGQAVDSIQRIDPATHQVSVVGHLPGPLAGAMAAVLGGQIYVAGGAAQTGATASPGPASTAIWAFDPAKGTMLNAGNLIVPTSYAGIAVVGSRAWIVGGESSGALTASVQMLTPNPLFGAAGHHGAGSPYYGATLLVADRGNDRLLAMTPGDHIVWTYPSASAPAPAGGFYFPDDAFFAAKGTEIISNQEENHTIVIIGYPSGKLLWSYGHPGVSGSGPGYLDQPDDAYLLRNGEITVADALNCRILFISHSQVPVGQIGTDGNCTHHPPVDVGYPNGDTPLADGNVLVSEIHGSWVSEYTPQGTLVWTVHLPLAYPSDPQQIGPDLYLIADYAKPGAIVEFNRAGQILYKYAPASGLGALDHPSLVELLPSGVFMTNDDYRDRMAAIDPATGALVWQYGTPGTPGTAPGFLNTPDGFDLLLPNGTTPTHPITG